MHKSESATTSLLEVERLESALQSAVQLDRWVPLEGYEPVDDPGLNEHCLFLKPELTRLGDRFSSVWELIADRLSAFDQEIVAGVALPGSYLQRHSVMEQHYGVIDDVSRRGRAAFSEGARMRFDELFSEAAATGSGILGAHQFLEAFPYFSARALADLYDNLNTQRLAGGTHAASVTIRGNQYVLLNGFHPDQLERFTSPDATTLVFVCRTSLAWSDIRRKFTGATNPVEANSGSIRAQLRSRREELGIPEVSSGLNGVHVSAGPIEGMVEVIRYLSNWDEGQGRVPVTSFQLQAEAAGLASSVVQHAARNGLFETTDRVVPAFDLTEELDSEEAIRVLAASEILQ